MNLALYCAMLVVAASGPVETGGKFDVKIENAVKGVIARKIGDLRGGFSFRQKPTMTTVESTEKKPSQPSPSSWEIVTSREAVDVSTFGSIQTFTDGPPPTPEERKEMARKTVTRVIKF